jgi:LCP family protein required for cell wall assembly
VPTDFEATEYRDTGEGGDGTGRGPRRRKNRAVWVVLSIVLVLVLGAGAVAVGYLSGLASTFDNSTEKFESAFPDETARPEKAEAREGRQDPVNILLLGADSGGGSGESEDLPGVPQSGRSDTMMWVHIPGDRKQVYVMSVMRDLWVDIPDQGTHKLNAAYSFGGVPKAVQTLETMFGTRLDHVVAVDLAGFKGLVDSLGGVQIDNPRAFTARHGRTTFQAGPQVMDGETALSFVRERYAFSDGDYSRVANQQLFMQAVARKVLTPETLTNPGRISDVVTELSPYLTVDDSLTAGEMVGMGRTMTDIRSGDIDMFTLPTKGVGRARGQSVVWPDEQAIEAIGSALSQDEMASYRTGQ